MRNPDGGFTSDSPHPCATWRWQWLRVLSFCSLSFSSTDGCSFQSYPGLTFLDRKHTWPILLPFLRSTVRTIYIFCLLGEATLIPKWWKWNYSSQPIICCSPYGALQVGHNQIIISLPGGEQVDSISCCHKKCPEKEGWRDWPPNSSCSSDDI